jgi:signal transduction histidine kinase
MNIYKKRTCWKIALLLGGLLIAGASLYFTNSLAEKLAEGEQQKVELWAEAMQHIAADTAIDANIDFIFKVIENNKTIPVVVIDSNGTIVFSRNVDSLKLSTPQKTESLLTSMKEAHPPIIIDLGNGIHQYLYYQNSILLQKIRLFPYVQLLILLLFVLLAYYALNTTRQAEQNQVWTGLSKETAHQLGTPISSLHAWIELLHEQQTPTAEILDELKKDADRLELIAERFSKVGALPELKEENIYFVVDEAVNYLKQRISKKIVFNTDYDLQKQLFIQLNKTLFGWVLENIIKNGVDAIQDEGAITISIKDHIQHIYIDISDTGKGIPSSKQKTIFKPGYTTKTRGWGLGLSLSKRIIENYHGGKIFVKSSEPFKKTTFRIVLKK